MTGRAPGPPGGRAPGPPGGRAGGADPPEGGGWGDEVGRGSPVDLRAEMRRGAQALRRPLATGAARGTTSDLSIDEALLLHSVGWEPVDLVFGVSVAAVPAGVWTWGRGEIAAASSAYDLATSAAAGRLGRGCASAGGFGVVGVRIEVEVGLRHVDVALTGTAVRPVGQAAKPPRSFVSDLSARDFALLHQAGWSPTGLAVGASFVYAPRRAAGTALRQSGQNVELVNYTQALSSAREGAMERMQRSAIASGGTGIVAVRVDEGPLPFARHVVRFTSWGTAVRLVDGAHRFVRPEVVLPLDDAEVQFEAESIRGR